MDTTRSLMKFIGISLVFAVIVINMTNGGEAKDMEPTTTETEAVKMAEFGMTEIVMDSLVADRKAVDLYQDYLGTSTDQIPDTLRTDFGDQLAALWQKKADRFELTDKTKEVGQTLLGEYDRKRESVSLPAYFEIIDRSAERMYQQMQWRRMCSDRLMQPRNCNLLQAMAASIGGRELLAIILTELMPSSDSDFNLTVLGLMGENAGRQYIESLPAVNDSLISFGPYQFTVNALQNKPGDVRGASVMASYLINPNTIPDEVAQLRGDDHHEAAYLFAVRNLARIIHRLTDEQLTVLENNWQSFDDEIAQLIAVSHHVPFYALDATRRWLDNDAQHDFSVSTSGRYAEYANKTKKNYQAIKHTL